MPLVRDTETKLSFPFTKDPGLGQELFSLKVGSFGSKHGGSHYSRFQIISSFIKLFTLKFPARFFLRACKYWFTDHELLAETLQDNEMWKWSLKTYRLKISRK